MTINKTACRLISCFALIVPFVLLHIFRQYAPFTFVTNDDVFINSIIDGEITGTPNPHMIHVGYTTGILLSMLYCAVPALPWYGMYLCFSIAITLSLVLRKLVRVTHSTKGQLLILCLFILGCTSFIFQHLVKLQFTFVAAFTAAGGLFLLCFYTPNHSLRRSLSDNIGFLFLTSLSCSIRSNACIMLLPFAAVIFSQKYLNVTDLRTSRKSVFAISAQRKKILVVVMLYITTISIICGVQFASSHTQNWNEYSRFSANRAAVVDYTGFPDYETHKELYDSMGITASSYWSISRHYGIIFEPNLTAENMETLALVSKTEAKVSPSDKIKHMMSLFWVRHINYEDRPLNLLVYAFYTLFLVSALVGRKKRAVVGILLTIAARMVIWTYLLYINRFPSRVTQGIYAAELFILLGIAFRNNLWESSVRPKIIRICLYVTITVFVAISVRFGIQKSIGSAYESRAMLIFSQAYEEMKTYFREHPDNFYYLDINSFGSFTRDALSGGREEYGNFIFTGSWLPNSPLYKEKLQQEGIEDAPTALFAKTNVYVVFMKSEVTDCQYLSDLYSQNYDGRILKITEEITTSGGLTFQIMKVYAPDENGEQHAQSNKQ